MSPEAVTEKGGETRKRILETARVAFTENGYRSTSMNDLIAAAGVTKGGFYFHFPSKADVGIEVVRSEQARLASCAMAGTVAGKRRPTRQTPSQTVLERRSSSSQDLNLVSGAAGPWLRLLRLVEQRSVCGNQ